jgi:membrane protein
MTVKPIFSRCKSAWHKALHFLDETHGPSTTVHPLLQVLRRTIQFIWLVIRGFTANRCPVRAAALSYTTLLALVPVLAVGLSFARNYLHDASEAMVPKMIDKFVEYVAPQLQFMPKDGASATTAGGQLAVNPEARQQAVDTIQGFINNIDSGALGVIGMVALIFIAIQLMMTIEATFNDIWGVEEGRTFWKKIVYYWTTVTLGPLLLILAMYMTGRAEFVMITNKLSVLPGAQKLAWRLVPFAVLWFGFALMYALMPNTRVRIGAALAGGVVGGTLWQLNSMLSAMYVSRVVTYSKIYGGLGMLPVLLVGLYFSWLIVLLGAQVSYAVQNLRSFLQQRASERVDQEGREMLACRLVLVASRYFMRGESPPATEKLAEELHAPPQLLNRISHRLIEGGVLAAITSGEGGLKPARPPEQITVSDVLHVMRSANGTCGERVQYDDTDPIGRRLNELYAVEKAAPANARFSDLAA